MIFDLLPTEDQQMIDASVGSLLDDILPVDRLRDEGAHHGRAETAAWSAIAELGLFGLALEEAAGGAGYGLPEQVLVARRLGRNLASPDVLAQMAAVHLCSDPSQRDALVSGEVRAAFAMRTGEAEFRILDGKAAQVLVIPGPAPALMFRTALSGQGETCCIDETLRLEIAAGNPGSAGNSGMEAERITILVAAYLVGMATACRDMAVAYAGTREQFGQPIGAFQAIKHMCADMAVKAAAAEAQCLFATMLLASQGTSGSDAASASLLCRKAALENARTNIQIHGGMGFTDECDAHRFLKRAHVIGNLSSSHFDDVTHIIKDGA